MASLPTTSGCNAAPVTRCAISGVSAGDVSSVSGIGTVRAPALAHHAQTPRVVQGAVERGARERAGGRHGKLGAAQPGRVGEQQQEA
ncbi:hypothetical protein [Burkholderia vietnamiensis]|uniref:hypothetical protein n=1 Tax=Burkholderia vietnamiensis TaxID=60552 RepID=UPI00075C5124|nr:hypothetical protein [Burkholderia vietnamiensis]AOJ16961.1 hypothetical protein WJ02_25065 [Burkholderia vietnamiensis]KVD99222.1 hypothetical protein WI91_27145 [Burkholderia vietnamiensis]KVE33090.1 hypothetical protein WI93_24770 [Burkholderia vietnamiensis]KVE64914.1 hypothetical protein WI97_17450 [Burkholderia vietnamiensis]KVF03049.1 hypothetical protein WJ03_02975 [Burkholderia vietnamiensis]